MSFSLNPRQRMWNNTPKTIYTMKTYERFFVRTCAALLLIVGGAMFAVSCEEEPLAPEEEPKEEPAPKPEVTLSAGERTETSVQFYLSATDADEIAYLLMEKTEGMSSPAVEDLFEQGEVVEASEEPVAYLESDLVPEKDYVVYAAASKEKDKVYYSDVKELSLTTSAIENILSFVSSSKTGFSYKVDVPEGYVYYHAYLEGWYFEYMYQLAIITDGAEFDEDVFVWNLLAEFGQPETSPKTIEWIAGQENLMRNDVAYLVPGKSYYALASRFDETTSEGWQGKPEYIRFEMEAPSISDMTVNCSVDELSYDSVSLRMEKNNQEVNFYFYGFYEKEQFDAFKADKGEDGMRDYVFEYGTPKSSTYTDRWMVDPGTSYMLCVAGVDYRGDVFYTELQVDTPMPEPSISLSMTPYERELEGYYSYNTLKVSCSFNNFGEDMDYGNYAFAIVTGVIPKSFFNEFVSMVGLPDDLNELEKCGMELYQYGVYNLGLYPMNYNDQVYSQLIGGNSYEWVISSGLQPDTEYVYIQIAAYNNEWYCRIVSAKTDAKPVVEDPTEAYLAYTGNWKLTGQMTTDWYTAADYDLKVEQYTANRSYKVYGWSNTKVAEDFPFIMNFDPATNKMSIETPQVLGEVTIEGKNYEVLFVGKTMNYSGELEVAGSQCTAYTGNINGSRMQFFPGIAGNYEVKTAAYVYRDKNTNEYYDADAYNIVNFIVNKVD